MSAQDATPLPSPRSSSESVRHSQSGSESILSTLLGVVRPTAIILVLSGGLAAGVVRRPLVTVAAAGGILAVMVARSMPRAIERLFLRLVFGGLIGYAILGRTFAGLGVPPVYVGEVILAVGLLSAIANGWHPGLVRRTPLIYLLMVFMGWGAACTIPYLGVYGLDALRDAVVWGYGLFVLLLAPLIVRRDLIRRIPTVYARAIPWILVIAPLWTVVGGLVARGGAQGSPKPGDAAVHLGGAAAFLLAAVPARRAAAGSVRGFAQWAAWPVLLLGLIAMGSLNRGGLVAALAAMLTVLMLLPSRAGGKLLLAAATAVLVATVWLGSGISIQIKGSERVIDPDQIAENLMSIGGKSGKQLDNTREWRLLWWGEIIDYTFHGKYFWTGKGYGVNLTYDDGIESDPNNPSRSPHNGHLTILARAGVPGLVLWGTMQAGFAFGMLAAFVRARRVGAHSKASIIAWILAYWLACMLNASFDPSLETPQGGIWFWCLFAYGVALMVDPGGEALPLASAARTRASKIAASGRP